MYVLQYRRKMPTCLTNLQVVLLIDLLIGRLN